MCCFFFVVVFFFRNLNLQKSNKQQLFKLIKYSFSLLFFLFSIPLNHLIAQVLEIPISYENFDDPEGSPECEFVPRTLPKQPESVDTRVSEFKKKKI